MWMSAFGELAVDGFFLEYDDARSDGFEPLRFVPRGKKRVVLGARYQQTGGARKQGRAEALDRRRGKNVPVEQLCLSPQCGFSSTVDGNALTRDEQIAKLAWWSMRS
jgi:5-methyltetrahydropteroyltriglutamate--homocysteine methyltransferase